MTELHPTLIALLDPLGRLAPMGTISPLLMAWIAAGTPRFAEVDPDSADLGRGDATPAGSYGRIRLHIPEAELRQIMLPLRLWAPLDSDGAKTLAWLARIQRDGMVLGDVLELAWRLRDLVNNPDSAGHARGASALLSKCMQPLTAPYDLARALVPFIDAEWLPVGDGEYRCDAGIAAKLYAEAVFALHAADMVPNPHSVPIPGTPAHLWPSSDALPEPNSPVLALVPTPPVQGKEE